MSSNLNFLKSDAFSLTMPLQYEENWICGEKKVYKTLLQEDSFLKAKGDDSWSSELEAIHEEPTKNGWIEVYERARVLEAFQECFKEEGKLLLEFGASTGYMVEELQEKFPGNKYIATDLYSEGLLSSYARHSNIMHIQCDITKAPFKDGSFDFVYGLNVLEHIENDIKTIEECYRILKKGGYCLFVVPRGQHLYDYFDEVLYHKRRYAENELKEKSLAAGFKIIKNFHFAWLCYPAFWLKKKNNQRIGAKLTQEEKIQMFEKETNKAMASKVGNIIMNAESFFSRFYNPNFGVREFILLKKD